MSRKRAQPNGSPLSCGTDNFQICSERTEFQVDSFQNIPYRCAPGLTYPIPLA